MESITRQTLSVAEAAEVLGISRAHAYDCVRSSELPSITLGRRVVIPLAGTVDSLNVGAAAAIACWVVGQVRTVSGPGPHR